MNLASLLVTGSVFCRPVASPFLPLSVPLALCPQSPALIPRAHPSAFPFVRNPSAFPFVQNPLPVTGRKL